MASYKDGELLAITYDVWINGKKLGMGKKQCINSIEVKETVDGSDSCTIKITDPEFQYIEDNIFIEDNKVKVKLGWVGVTYRSTFKGYISAVDVVFDQTGCPQLTITCMDNTHLMNRKAKDSTFENTTSAEVVKKIVKSYGFKCVVESGYTFDTQETITQSHQTDIAFITQLAGSEVYPFTARLVGDTFYYVKKGHLGTSKMTLTYRQYPHDIISFNPKINKETIKQEVSSAKVDSSTKATTSTTITSDKTSDSKTSGSSSDSGSSSSSGKNYTYNPNTNKWTKS